MADGAVAATGEGAQAAAPQTAQQEAPQAQPEAKNEEPKTEQPEETKAQEETPKEQKSEEPAKKTGRERLMERYAKSYPDRKFEGETADNDLFDLTADEFDRYEKEHGEYKEKSDRLNKLFNDFPESSEIFKAMVLNKEHPFDYIIDNYGDRLAEALGSEEGKASLKKHREDKAKRDAENAEADKQFEANVAESLKTLEKWGLKKKLDTNAQAEHFLAIRQALNDFADGKISEETYDLFWNGAHYNNDVALAREEGEVNGRNAKIEAERLQSKARKASAPTLGGRGGASEEDDGNRRSGIMEMFGVPIKR